MTTRPQAPPFVPFLDLAAQYASLRPEIDVAIQHVLETANGMRDAQHRGLLHIVQPNTEALSIAQDAGNFVTLVPDQDDDVGDADRFHHLDLILDQGPIADWQNRLGKGVAERRHTGPAARRQNGPHVTVCHSVPRSGQPLGQATTWS